MAATSRTIKVIFDGTTTGITTAAAVAKRAIRSVTDENNELNRTLNEAKGFTSFIGGLSKVIGIAGAGAASIQAVVSTGIVLTSTLVQLAPAVLILPGLFLGAFAALEVFKLGTENFAKALGGSDKAFQKLSQNAKDTVTTLQSFKGGLDALQQSLQQTFFQGFADQIKETGNVLLPILQTKLGAIAQGFNQMGIAAIAAARTPFFTGALTSILDNTGTAMGNLKNSLANALTGFVGLGTIGAQYLPRIATGIDNVAARFNNWVQTGLKDGSIQQFVNDAITGFKSLGVIIGNIGSIFKEVFTGLNAGLGAGGALSSIIATTAAVKEFLATADAQSGLKTLGETIKALGDAFRGVLLEALKQLTPVLIALGPFLIQLATTLGSTLISALQIAGPLLLQFATFLSNNAGAAAAFTVVLIGIGAAIKVVAVVVPIIEGIGAAFTAVSTVVGFFAGVIGDVIGAVGLIAAQFGGLSGILSGIGSALAAAGTAIGAVLTAPATLIVAAIALIVGAFVLAYNKVAGFRAIVDTVVGAVVAKFHEFIAVVTGIPDAIGSAVSAIPGFFSGLVETIVGFFTALPGRIGAVFSTIGSAISTAFTAVVTFISNIPTQIVAVFTTIGATISAFFAALPANAAEAGIEIGVAIGQILNFFINLWTQVVTATQTAFAQIVAFVTALPGQIGAALTALGASILAGATAAWNFLVTATTTAITSAVAFVTALPGRIGTALATLGTTLTTVATTAWNSFKTTTTNLVNTVIAYIKTIPSLVTSGLASLATVLKTAATTGWNAFTTAIKTAAAATLAYVKSVPGLIVSAIGNLGSTLVAAGRALIDGLLAGIKAGYNAMISFVKGIAAGIAAVKGPLPKDLRLLIPAGLAIMKGLLSGLQTGHADVLAFVAGIAQQIQAKLAGGVQAGLGTVVPGADASLSVVHTINDRQSTGDVMSVVGAAIQAGLSQAAPPVTNINVDPKVDALHEFINVKFAEFVRDTRKIVGQGNAISFGSR